MLNQAVFYFSGLYPVASYLYLVIDSAHINHFSVGKELCQITRSIQPFPRLIWIFYKFNPVQFRPFQVSATNALPAYTYFSCNTYRCKLKIPVHDICCKRWYGPADIAHIGVYLVVCNFLVCDMNGCFRYAMLTNLTEGYFSFQSLSIAGFSASPPNMLTGHKAFSSGLCHFLCILKRLGCVAQQSHPFRL